MDYKLLYASVFHCPLPLVYTMTFITQAIVLFNSSSSGPMEQYYFYNMNNNTISDYRTGAITQRIRERLLITVRILPLPSYFPRSFNVQDRSKPASVVFMTTKVAYPPKNVILMDNDK